MFWKLVIPGLECAFAAKSFHEKFHNIDYANNASEYTIVSMVSSKRPRSTAKLVGGCLPAAEPQTAEAAGPA